MIRRLASEDWPIWKSIRLEMLQSVPEAFGASYEEDAAKSDEDWENSLVKSDIFGAFQAGILVGTIGFYRDAREKKKHIGGIWAVYVQVAYRGTGLADKLLSAVIEHARHTVSQIQCTVVAGNTVALKLYQGHGFLQIGLEPRALNVSGQFYDEILMMKFQAKINIRHAKLEDIASMVNLSYEKRRAYERVQSQFWRYKKGAEASQANWFQQLLNQKDHILLVAESEGKIAGFVIGQLITAPEVYDPGLTLMIDDFCVATPGDWPSIGAALLSQLKSLGKEKGVVQLVMVSGAHDEPKRQFLKQAGLSVASEWYVDGDQ